MVYLLASSLIGIFQQSLIFKKDTTEMEAEVISVKSTPESKLKQEVSEIVSSATKPEPEATSPQKINKGKVVTKTRIITPGFSDTPKKAKRKKRRK